MEEVWKDIKGYEGIYQISNYGRVYSLVSNRILKPSLSPKGYVRVRLCVDNIKTNHSIHRLVAEAFISNPDKKPCINHINTVRDDNRVENLEWCTYKENSNNPITVERYKNKTPWNKGKASSEETRLKQSESHRGKKLSEDTKRKIGDNSNKPVVQLSKDGVVIKIYNSINEASEEMGIERSCISHCLGGRSKTSGGYRWVYN